jgi:uncharacterized membrane protein YbhN (UPF0104 family)
MKFRPNNITSIKQTTNGAGRFRFCVSALIFATVLGFLFFYRSQLITALLAVDIRWVTVGLFCYGLNYVLRSFRLCVISRGRIIIWPNAIYASSLHGFFTYLMPLQVGDLSLPVILKNTDGIALSHGSVILIRIRLLDMFSLGALMIAAAMVSGINIRMSLRLIWVLIGGVLVITPFFIHHLIRCNWLQTQRFGRYLKPFTEGGKFSLNEFLLSLGIWASIASVFFCVATAIHLPISFGGVLLLLTIQLPLQLIPIQGLANTGNHEAGWIATLSLLGIPVAIAAEFAVTSHIIILCYVLCLGTVPLFIKPRKQPE